MRILLCYWRLFLTFSFLIVRDLDWSIHRLPPPFAGLNCRVWLRPGRPASCYSRSAYQPSRMAFAKVYERDHCSLGRWTHFWHLCGYLTAVGRPSTLGGRQITCGRGVREVPTHFLPHSFAINPNLCGIFIFKYQSWTFFNSEAVRGRMQPQKQPQDYFLNVNTCDIAFLDFF